LIDRLKGVFNFPDSIILYPGILEVTDEPTSVFTAELFLEFINPENSHLVNQLGKQGNIIHGNLENSQIVTLFIRDKKFSSHNGIQTFVLFIDYVFFNRHIQSFNGSLMDLQFVELRVNFTGLYNWINRNTIETFSNTPKKTLLLTIKEFEIEFIYSWRFDTNGSKSKYDLVIRIRTMTPKKFIEVLNISDRIQDFFNFFYSKEVMINFMEGIMNDSNEVISIVSNTHLPKKMKKIGPSGFVFDKLFLNSDKTEFIFPKILTNWFKLYEHKEKNLIFDYFFSLMQDHGSLQENLLVSMCAFVESYYDHYIKEDIVSPDLISWISNRKELKQKILREFACEVESDENFRMYLNSIDNPPFKFKLQEIFRKYIDIAPLWSSVLYYFSLDEIMEHISILNLDNKQKKNLGEIIVKSKDLERKEDHTEKIVISREISNQLENDTDLKRIIIILLNSLYENKFPQQVQKYRNSYVHGQKEIRKTKPKRWTHLVDNMQFISQLCILTELGYTIENLKELYHIGGNIPVYRMILNLE
jgi:hypothetical protein